MKKIINGAFIGFLVLFLLGGLGRTVFFPREINALENRYAYKIEAFTMEKFLDGSFQKEVKDALGDQVPLSTTIKKAYNYLTAVYENAILEQLITEDKEYYVSYKGGWKFRDYLVYETYRFEDIEELLDKKMTNTKQQVEKNSDTSFYAYYIETDPDIYFETNEKVGVYEYLETHFDDMQVPFAGLKINNFQDYAKYFYKTDHHWNCYGSYKAYEDLMALMEVDEELVSIKKEYLLDNSFSGSKAIGLGANGIITESIPAYLYDFSEMGITINDVPVEDYGAQEQYINGMLEDTSYAAFYGNDHAKIVIDTKNENKENILLIGNSYDNAILKLVASHFNQTHSIDLRHYEKDYGQKFQLSKYIEENNISKVVYIGHVDFYTSETFLLEE